MNEPGSVVLHGSQGEVMAQLGSGGTFYRGKHQVIRVTQIGPDADTPLVVREALVGLKVAIIFNATLLAEQKLDKSLRLPKGACLAYGVNVIKALEAAGKEEAVAALQPFITSPFDMYAFESEIYELFQEGV